MKKKTLKCLMLSLGLATMTLAANNLNAQTGGGLLGKGGQEDAGELRSGLFDRSSSGIGFHISIDQFDNGGPSGTFHIGTQQFGQDVDDAPLGSGLFIMAAAGAAYVLKKRKTNK